MITDAVQFSVIRLRYLKVAVDALPTFKPDGKTPEDVGNMLENAIEALSAGFSLEAQLNMARGNFESQHQSSHAACVDVYACMKSCYRGDAGALAAIIRVATEDRTPNETFARMQDLAAVWGNLPNAPGTDAPLAVRGINPEVFSEMIAGFDVGWQAYTNLNAQVRTFEGALRAQNDVWEDFVTAALAQGRANFPQGTEGRSYIDAIPTQPASQPPGQAEITVATSPAPTAVHLEFTAPHATSFQVWHKGPNDEDFSQVADVLLPGVYDAVGLSGGEHEYKIIGENSRGDGEASPVTDVAVGLALAA